MRRDDVQKACTPEAQARAEETGILAGAFEHPIKPGVRQFIVSCQKCSVGKIVDVPLAVDPEKGTPVPGQYDEAAAKTAALELLEKKKAWQDCSHRSVLEAPPLPVVEEATPTVIVLPPGAGPDAADVAREILAAPAGDQ